MIEIIIGVMIFFSMNLLFYFTFADKEKISLKTYLKGAIKFVLKAIAVVACIGLFLWIPLILTALTK